jgi:hypothetical protein
MSVYQLLSFQARNGWESVGLEQEDVSTALVVAAPA